MDKLDFYKSFAASMCQGFDGIYFPDQWIKTDNELVELSRATGVSLEINEDFLHTYRHERENSTAEMDTLEEMARGAFSDLYDNTEEDAKLVLETLIGASGTSNDCWIKVIGKTSTGLPIVVVSDCTRFAQILDRTTEEIEVGTNLYN